MNHRVRPSSRAPARLRPLVLSLALALAGTSVGVIARTPTSAELDAAVPTWLSDTDKAVFRKQLTRMAAHVPAPVPATSIPVSNCDDSGAGSLRDAVNAAVDGDTIDLTALPCSTITLTSGAISIGVDNLTIQGPNALLLTVDAGYNDRAFWHLGSGQLTIADLTVSHGHKYLNNGDVGNAGGACVLTSGQLNFEYSWAKYCEAGSNDPNAIVHGGAIYAASGVFMEGSMVTGSSAISHGYAGRGGGIYTPGDLLMTHSTVSGNTASESGAGIGVGSVQDNGTPGGDAQIKYSTINSNTASGGIGGGGVYLTGTATIGHSTISGNEGCRGAGVYLVHSANTTSPASIYSSTVSGNIAQSCGTHGAGGIQSFFHPMEVEDSTIAFNQYLNGTDTKYGAGIQLYGASNTLDLQNTIVAGNMTELNGNDLEPDDTGGTDGATVTGANNLVYMTDIVLPSGTILLTDPMLRALAANGGETATHMPNFGSPVIDAGNNASGATVDQRGAGHPRILGPAADIGAVEFDLPDLIFANGFD